MSNTVAKPPPDEDVPDWVGAYESTCIGCGQTDNHPMILTGPLDEAPIYWHHDCFVIAKRPGWEDIKTAIEGAQGATGHALRMHLAGHRDTTPGQGN